MKKLLIVVGIMLMFTSLNAQSIRWSYDIDGSVNGAGRQWTFSYGFWKWTAAVEKEDTEGERVKKKIKPRDIHYYFQPFNAKQLIVTENYNPGAIEKIMVGHHPNGSRKPVYVEVYSGTAQSKGSEYIVNNYELKNMENVTDVVITMNYQAVPGVNQIAGVCLANFTRPYVPGKNILPYDAFEGEPLYMNDDVSGRAKPTTPIITVDNKYMYFNHKYKTTNIYRATIGPDGTFTEVVRSQFNLPDKISYHTGIRMVSQDNNMAYVTSYDIKKLKLYKVYQTKNFFGKMKWRYDLIKVQGYENEDDYQNELVSYDGQYLLVRMKSADKTLSKYNADIYVAKRKENGDYGKLIRLSDDINTLGDEIPSFLAPDNKTLYFASDGHIGYGDADIYMTRRLDDTWQNWTQPVNLGPMINSSATENYFTMDAASAFVYFIRWNDDGSDIYRLKVAEPEEVEVDTEQVVATSIKPEPVIVITGKVLNKKTNEPVYSKIEYMNLETGEILGRAISNAETGEYSVALPFGINYLYEAQADKYLPVSENINTTKLSEFQELERNLYLVPIEVGQTVRLNNIFFDLNKATIKEESKYELEKLYKILSTNKSMKIEIGGHTDNVGSESYNKKLSDERAKAVVQWLVDKGIEVSRLVGKGYGEDKPVATNDTEEGRALNRRVEFTILEK